MRTAAWAAAALAGLLSACAPAGAPAVGVGRVDPEQVRDSTPVASVTACTPHLRGSLPLEFVGLPVVQASVNGRPARFILDTGAESSLLTAGAARRLQVTRRYDFQRSLAGIGGVVATGDARLESMSLGGVALSFPRVLVGELSFPLAGAEPDGLLGASLLGDFDLDIDLPRRRLDLYDRMECPDARPAWRGPYATLDTTRSLSQHPFFPLRVNGRTLSATLDTGAQRSVIAARAAAAVGIGADTLVSGPVVRTRGAAGEIVPATVHVLRDASVGGIKLRAPVLVLPATLPRDIDALLGVDFLLGNRVWLSYGSRRIFIQPG